MGKDYWKIYFAEVKVFLKDEIQKLQFVSKPTQKATESPESDKGVKDEANLDFSNEMDEAADFEPSADDLPF